MPDASLLSDEQARELARDILARPEYATYRRPRSGLQEWVDGLADWIRSLEDRVPQWLVDLWSDFWGALGQAFGGALGDDTGVMAARLVVAALLLGGLGWMATRLARDLRRRRLEPRAAAPSLPDARPEWIAEAEVFARQGRFVEAAHCTQLASLQLLLRKHWLELERSDPNRTLRRRLAEARLPEVIRARFVALLDRLEGCWFRDRVEDRDLYADWRAIHAEIAALPEGR